MQLRHIGILCHSLPSSAVPPEHKAILPFYRDLYFHLDVVTITSPSAYEDVKSDGEVRKIFRNRVLEAREKLISFDYPSEQDRINAIFENIKNYDFENGNLDGIIENVYYLTGVHDLKRPREY